MNAELINALKATIENNANSSDLEIPQGPVRFKFLAVKKFGNGERFISGFHPETGATARFDDQNLFEELKALGAKPSAKKTIEVESDDGPTEVTLRQIEGFAIEAVITSFWKKSAGKRRIVATVKNAKVVKSGLELDKEWDL